MNKYVKIVGIYILKPNNGRRGDYFKKQGVKSHVY